MTPLTPLEADGKTPTAGGGGSLRFEPVVFVNILQHFALDFRNFFNLLLAVFDVSLFQVLDMTHWV